MIRLRIPRRRTLEFANWRNSLRIHQAMKPDSVASSLSKNPVPPNRVAVAIRHFREWPKPCRGPYGGARNSSAKRLPHF